MPLSAFGFEQDAPEKKSETQGHDQPGKSSTTTNPSQGALAHDASHIVPQPTPSEGDTPAAHEISLGVIYEKEDRLPDAEKAYAKSLETASGPDRQNARQHLEAIFRKEKGLQIKYLEPSFEEASLGVWKTMVSIVETLLLLGALWLGTKFVRRLGEHLGKNKVQIADFIDATGEGGALAFAEQLRNAIEQVEEFYRARDPFRLGSYSGLLVVSSPAPSKMVELASELISSPLGKLVPFFADGFFRPQYKIAGMVQKTGLHYSCWVKVYRSKEMFGSWESQFPAQQCSEMQEQLAYEVAMRLKEEVDATGN